MKLRSFITISIALVMLTLPACAPKNSYKGRQFGGETDLGHTGPVMAKAFVSADDIAKALTLKSVESYSTSEQIAELAALVEETKAQDFVLTDVELDSVDQGTVDAEGFVTLQTESNITARLKPLVAGILYQLEVSKEDGKVSLPGIVLRKQIGTSPASDELASTQAKTILEKLNKKDLVIQAVRIHGRPDFVQLSAEIDSETQVIDTSVAMLTLNSEILARGKIDSSGLLNASTSGTLESLKADILQSADAANLIEAQLFGADLNVVLSSGTTVVGTYKFSARGKQLNEDMILKIKESLKKQINLEVP